MKCFRLGCMNEAQVFPVVSFAGNGGLTRRVEFELPLLICMEHATSDPSHFVSDEAWLLIVAALRSLRTSDPDRRSLQVRYEPI